MEEKLGTNCEGLLWILEEEDKETNGPEIKTVKPRRESLLQFVLIDEATPIPVHHLKAGYHILGCPWWKTWIPRWRNVGIAVIGGRI